MVGIHPKRIAFAPNSWPIAGSAIFMDEPTKGVKNEDKNAIRSA